MTILFGSLGDGGTIRAFAVVAGFATLGAVSIGAEAERYAQSHRAALSLTPIPGLEPGGLSQSRLNGVDYGATGSLEPRGQGALACPERAATFWADAEDFLREASAVIAPAPIFCPSPGSP